MSTVGDIGHVDADGYVYLTDRAAFMIISGGVNIYPQECENLLVTHPKVADVAVFGVPNEEMGEEVKAVVQLMPGVEPGPEIEAELIAFCREHLAHHKCPRSIDFEDGAAAAADRQALQGPVARPLLEGPQEPHRLRPSASSARHHVGERVAHRSARDAEQPAVGHVEVEDHEHRRRDGNRRQADDDHGHGVRRRGEPDAREQNDQPEDQHPVERRRHGRAGLLDHRPSALDEVRILLLADGLKMLVQRVGGLQAAQRASDAVDDRAEDRALAGQRHALDVGVMHALGRRLVGPGAGDDRGRVGAELAAHRRRSRVRSRAGSGRAGRARRRTARARCRRGRSRS